MITFKHFLLEGTAEGAPPLQHINHTSAEALDIIKTQCSQSIAALKAGKILYRGDSAFHGIAVVDPTKSKRVSANTTNYYTLILDNNPHNVKFPKRSQSLICSSDSGMAWSYGHVSVVIPFDGVKIGCVNSADLWNKKVKIFGVQDYIQDINKFFARIPDLSPNNWQTWIDFDKKLKNDPAELKKLKAMLPKADEHFLAELYQAYSYEKLGCTLHTTKNMDAITRIKSEAWVGGPALIISHQSFDEIKNQL